MFQNAKSSGLIRIALAGKSDLAEIAAICALESDVRIVAVVDVHATSQRFMNFPLVRSFDDIAEELNAVVVTDLQTPRETCEAAIIRFGADRVLIPQLLRIHLTERPE